MKKFSFILTLISVCMISSCTSHDCVAEWSYNGSRKGYPEIAEKWNVDISSDGTCTGYHAEKGGGVDYEDYYSGTWEPISDDVIRIDMQSEDRIHRTTYSQNQIENEVSKAQTPWAEHKAYERTSGTHITAGHNNVTYYIRNDGAVSLYPDDFSFLQYKFKKN